MKVPADQAIAQSLIDNKLDLITWLPALGVSEIIKSYNEMTGNDVPYSFNEETAWSIAHGAAMYGGYAVSIMKAHGVLKAANAISDSMFAELSGGLVLILVDDIEGIRSDSIVYGEKILTGLEMPFFKADNSTICRYISEALDQSHRSKIPYAVIIDTAEVLNGSVHNHYKQTHSKEKNQFIRKPERKVLCPMLTGYQRRILNARLSGTNPEAVPFPQLPRIPEDIPPYWHSAIDRYTPLMSALRSIKSNDTLITSDIGFFVSFAFSPFFVQDICTFMGGSISLAAGAVKVGCPDAWAITGDFSFIGAGHLTLLEPDILNLPVKVVIIANLMAETTGMQRISPDDLERTLHIVDDRVTHTDCTTDSIECTRILLDAKAQPGLRVVVFHYRI